MDPEINKSKYFLLFAIVVVAFSMGVYFAPQIRSDLPRGFISVTSGDTQVVSEKSDSLTIPVLTNVWKILKEGYYQPAQVDFQKMSYGAARGFVQALGDPYTVFMDPSESKEFSDGLEGILSGIGAQLEVQNGKLVVITPLKKSPALKAGVLAGDIVYKINGELVEDLSLVDAVNKIRGPKGSQVTLTLIRESSSAPIEVKIIRDSITLESVVVDEPVDGIYHVALNQFNDTTKREFTAAIEKILLEKGVGVVLDVRGNGGGFLDVSIDILSELIKGEKIAVIVRERAKKDDFLKTSGNARLSDVPIVLLVDQGSASASEIVAGALQDYKRAIIMGEKTYGKGTVQEIKKLSDSSSMRFTVAEWFTPKDRSIQKNGIMPDIVVEFTPEDHKKGVDPQLNAAVKYLQTR